MFGRCILETGLWLLKIEKEISTLKNTFSYDENSLRWFKQTYPPLILKTHELILLLTQIIEEAEGQGNLSQESPHRMLLSNMKTRRGWICR